MVVVVVVVVIERVVIRVLVMCGRWSWSVTNSSRETKTDIFTGLVVRVRWMVSIE